MKGKRQSLDLCPVDHLGKCKYITNTNPGGGRILEENGSYCTWSVPVTLCIPGYWPGICRYRYRYCRTHVAHAIRTISECYDNQM